MHRVAMVFKTHPVGGFKQRLLNRRFSAGNKLC